MSTKSYILFLCYINFNFLFSCAIHSTIMFGIYIALVLFLIDGSLGVLHTDECMTDCGWSYEYNWWCWKDYRVNWDKCSQIKGVNKMKKNENRVENIYKYKMANGGTCTGRCGKFGYDYTWCMHPSFYDWSKCKLDDVSEYPGWRTIKLQISLYIDNRKNDVGPCNHMVSEPTNTDSAKVILTNIKAESKYIYHDVDNDSNSPITDMHYIFIPGTDGRPETQLTLALSAKIQHKHIKQPQCHELDADGKKFIQYLSPKKTDQTKYLISAAFSGTNQFWNIAPIAGIANYYYNYNVCNHGISLWDHIDASIYKLINSTQGKNGVYAEYNLIVNYEDLPTSLRPTHFILQINLKYGNGIPYFYDDKDIFDKKDSIEVFIYNQNLSVKDRMIHRFQKLKWI